ncbi:CheR family methyltransferase [Thiovibrio frasassiensis]|uniref:protein-glutamate O-methyltransferase n=1 Tax=Thiovibrio frasassiensis TaxID=2984131 RepID=A0A9X4MEH2_9BACT|nr:protein-glutamate O-methyltransferase [Thiovibrio frasassiensis]MDG4474813.1 protein-glutamate O-methyltransferase [Thiovibrio frasassiensis]
MVLNSDGPSNMRYQQLTDGLFQKFSDLVYEKTGIFLKPEKKELLNARLGKRLRATGIESFKEYYEYVIHDRSGEELVHLIDNVSTNFTSFFRENSHFEILSSTVLPAFVKEGRGKNKEILLWSSASSSGEEPYTMAMVVENFASQHPGMRYRIMATDISTRVLAQAKRGVYAEERVAKVPKPFLKKYFQKGVGSSDGYVKVKDELRRVVQFDRFNLMGDFPWRAAIDVIFCRNVMIYFNRETQQELVSKFHDALTPGGYLFIGHSESISGLKHSFTQVDATAYMKR